MRKIVSTLFLLSCAGVIVASISTFIALFTRNADLMTFASFLGIASLLSFMFAPMLVGPRP